MTPMQMKLELVAVPVSDVDRAKAFYTEKIGFHADHDYQVRDDLRFVQLTPPGSACSIVIGVGITDMPPGSQKGLQMVVADVKAVRDELVKRGVAVSEIEVLPWGSSQRAYASSGSRDGARPRSARTCWAASLPRNIASSKLGVPRLLPAKATRPTGEVSLGATRVKWPGGTMWIELGQR